MTLSSLGVAVTIRFGLNDQHETPESGVEKEVTVKQAVVSIQKN